MVREVVEEDVFVVVVLRPHADRDEEATRRNIFFVFCFFFVLCSFRELWTLLFFFVASFSQNLAIVCFVVTEKTRVASKTRESEKKANLSRLSLRPHQTFFFFPF